MGIDKSSVTYPYAYNNLCKNMSAIEIFFHKIGYEWDRMAGLGWLSFSGALTETAR